MVHEDGRPEALLVPVTVPYYTANDQLWSDRSGLPFPIRRETIENILKEPGCWEAGRNDAVNWADLHCVEIVHGWNLQGESEAVVYIEEVSPSAGGIMRYVYDKLHKAHPGWNLTIQTEW